jgi:hypothetical protein
LSSVHIHTAEGAVNLFPGDWILGPGSIGEFWPVKEEAFKKTYRPADSAGESHGS